MAHREDDRTHHVATAVMVSGWGGATPALHEGDKRAQRFPLWPVLTVVALLVAIAVKVFFF